MYSLEQLEQKNIKQLKEIGWQLNLLPEGDKRCRQNWINALVGINPPLLQLLEVSSAASVEQVQEPIMETVEAPSLAEVDPVYESLVSAVETSPGVEVDQAQELIAPAFETFSGVEVEQVQEVTEQATKTSAGIETEYPRNTRRDCPRCMGVQSLYQDRNCVMESWVIRCLYCDYERFKDLRSEYLARVEPIHGPDEYPWYKEAVRQASVFQSRPLYKELVHYCSTWGPIAPPTEHCFRHCPAPDVEIAQELIVQAAENSLGVEVEPLSELNSKFGRIVYPRPTAKIESKMGQSAMIQGAENFPGVEVEPVTGPITQVTKKLPGSRSKASTPHQLLELFQSRAHIIEAFPGVKTEITVSEGAIGLPAKNPILTGITFSDRFLVCYSPPQPEIIHFQSDADGQLSLLNFEIESVDEPPDPDDFESLDAFREALARWDFEHPEELAVSLDSMCEWAPCPGDWYEFDTELELSQVSELSRELEPSQVSELFTFNFSIPTFSAEDDRPNRTDESHDTGTFAKLPKPKPPSFPPATVSQAQPKPQPAATQLQAKRIPNAYQTHTCCIAAGSSTQLARSPPFGDAGF
jgi:hypothetical protein